MSRELFANVTLAYNDGVSQPVWLQIANFYANVATKVAFRGQQSIGITDTLLDFGSVVVFGYWVLVNLDPTNYVDLKVEAGGTIIARLDPAGGFIAGKIGSGITAPAALANTAPCILDMLICSL
jgi:hypothetical protein